MGTGIGGVFAGKSARAMKKAFEDMGGGMEIKVVAYSQEMYERFKRIMGE